MKLDASSEELSSGWTKAARGDLERASGSSDSSGRMGSLRLAESCLTQRSSMRLTVSVRIIRFIWV